jgi:hypothetical protein
MTEKPQEYVGYEESANPELLVYTNPGRRHFRGGVGSLRVRHHRRRRSRNYPVTVMFKGRRHTWKTLVRQYGVKVAARHWHRGRKYHGYTKRGVRGHRVSREFALNRKRCGRKNSYRALVRRLGVKRAAKQWRKRGRR